MATGTTAQTPTHLEGPLGQVIEALRARLGDDLVAVMLFGGAARGEHTPRHSDTNLLVVLREVGTQQLAAVAREMRRAAWRIRLAPVFLSEEDLTRGADTFAIELTEMQGQRVVLYGPDLLAEVRVVPERLRVQVEHELRTKLVQLRQNYLRAAGNPRAVGRLTVTSFGSFLTLFGALLRAQGEQPAATRAELTGQVAAAFGVEPEVLARLLAARMGQQPIRKAEAEDLFARYLRAVETVVAAVDRAGQA